MLLVKEAMTLWVLDREGTDTNILSTPSNVDLFLKMMEGRQRDMDKKVIL